MLWTRALPGSVAVIAALSVPGLSLGAGFLAEGQATDAAQGKDAQAAAVEVSPVVGSGLAHGERATQSLRAMLEPWAATTPSGRQIQVAEQAAPVAPLSSPLFPAEPRKRVPEISAVSAAPLALAAVFAVSPLAETVSAATVTSAPAVPAAVRAAVDVVPAIFTGNMSGGEVPAAPVLSASSRPEAALSPSDAMIGVGAVSAAPRAYAPGRREPLVPIASAPLPAAAPASVLAAAPVPSLVSAEALGPVSAAVPSAAAVPAAAVAVPAAVPRVADERTAPPAAARSRAVPAAPVTAARPPASTAPALAPALAPLPRAKLQPPAAAAAAAAGRADALRVDVKSQLLTRIDGKSAGTIEFRQTDAGLQVRLGSIVDLLGARYDSAQIARIRASSASNVYLSLAQLQTQGIPISYDPVYDEFNVGTVDARPKARLKVHMDQISTPERGLGSTAMEQARR